MSERDANYRSLFDHALNGLAHCKVLTEGPPPHDHVYLEVNESFEKLIGLKNLVGKKATEVIPGIREQDPWLLDLYSEVAETGRPRKFERYVEAMKTWLSASVYSPEKGQFVAILMDIGERKKAEESLALSEARYRRLFDSSTDGLVVVDMAGVIQDFNEAYRQMVGYPAEELRTVTYKQLTPEAWHEAEARIVEGQVFPRGFSDVYQKEYRRRDGKVFPVELRTILLREGGRPVAMWAIVRDVTETRMLQAQLALASRLSAMGTLVTGVAHEINNPLAAEMADQGLALEVVRDVQERLLATEPLDRTAEGRALDTVIEALRDAQEGGARIARIVKDLTIFGRPDSRRKPARLIDIVEGAMRWLPASIARTASIQVENGGAPDVIAASGQIEQVIVNLVTNAATATPEGKRDTVIVRIGPGKPGTARLEVVDHGSGIDPAIRDRIFDPFFTTRQAGTGKETGLGLAISHAIVTSHGGTFTVESEVGTGSTFRIELPIADGEP